MLELLMPAGNLKKLKTAFHFGADAVYLGGKAFSLRAFADNFSEDEIVEAANYAHALGKKVYVTVNIFAKNQDLDKAKEYFEKIEGTKIIPPKVNIKVDNLLREFILSGGFEVELPE